MSSYDEHNRLESIASDSTMYYFEYDVFGNNDSISVGSRELAGYEYNPYNGKLKKQCCGNGFAVRYVYDELDNVTEIWYTIPVRNSDGTVTYVCTAIGGL